MRTYRAKVFGSGCDSRQAGDRRERLVCYRFGLKVIVTVILLLFGFVLMGVPAMAYDEGASNNFFGTGAGSVNTGVDNSFFGGYAGYNNTTAYYNSFFGGYAGYDNTTGGGSYFFGAYAGYKNTTGSANSFFGLFAGEKNTTGGANSFFGYWAGYNNTDGYYNSFFGLSAGYKNTTGYENSFFGSEAGYKNTTGYYNSFFGRYAGYSNTTGNNNSFFGYGTGYSNTTGYLNSFFGETAGNKNTTGYLNSFFGQGAGYSNTTGNNNSFFGRNAGRGNTTGSGNSFFGWEAGRSNTVESYNTFVGYNANLDPGASPATNPVTHATAIGARAYVAQSYSLVLGSIAGVNGAGSDTNVGIGTPAPVRQLHLKGDNAVFRMDRSADTAAFMLVRTDDGGTPLKTFVVGTNASGSNNGEFVINDLGTAVGGPGNRRMTITNAGNVTFTGTVTAPGFFPTSSLAYKTNVQTYENALDTVNRLRGVRFDWKESGTPSVGLIAEEVERVVPEVVSHDGGTARGINYDSLVGVLVEAVKEQERERGLLEATVKAQQMELADLKEEMQEAIAQLMAEITKLKTRDMIAQR